MFEHRESHILTPVSILLSCSVLTLSGMLYRLQVIVENIKGVRAAKGIFKATYPALRNMQTQTTHEGVQSPGVYPCKNL